MKTALNALAIGLFLVWAGAQFLEELGRSFGNASSHLSHGETGVAVVVLVATAVLASVIASRYSEGNRAWALTALPFVVVMLGHAFLDYRLSSAVASRDEERQSRARLARSRFDAIPADFTHRGGFGESSGRLASILVIDAATQAMVRVDHEEGSVDAFCVGGIDGSTLELWGEMGVQGYTDSAGRTVEDRFTVVRRLQPERTDCGYERYSF